MPDVHIIFPKSGSEAIVTHDNMAMMQGQVVAWHVKSENPRVKKVRIEFDTGGGGTARVAFFPGQTPEHAITRELRPSKGGTGRAIVWGLAPEDNVGSQERYKYTIHGLDNRDQDAVPALDPRIITERP